MGYILVFDLGTTSVKAVLFDEELKRIDLQSVEYTLIAGQASRVEYPAEGYWNALCRAAECIFERRRDAAEKIAGISVTTQGETLIPVDERGEALRRAIVWLDGRAETQAAAIRTKIKREDFFRITGVPECTGLCPLSKLIWLKENEKAIYQKTRWFLLLGDYILFKLTGIICTEKTLLSTTGYFRIDEDRVWDELLEDLGLARDRIPPVKESGEVIGAISPEAARQLGLNDRALVTSGAMDQICGAVGAGNFVAGTLTEVTGTALCVGATIPKQAIDGRGSIPVYRHIFTDRYLVLPVSMTAGMALKWFRDTFCPSETEEAARTGQDVYDLLGALAASSPPLARGLLHIPYLSGSIQPDNNPAARGAFTGIGLEHTRADFIRAIFEGVAYMLRENIELLRREFSITGSNLRSLGGGSRSPLWNQIKADITGLSIETMGEPECTAAGAAALCAVSIRMFNTVEDAVRAVNRPLALYTPHVERKIEYDKGYADYNKIYAAINR
ncbi:xylulokinase [Spirochaetia bacterium]|nr:xylulokinase [Spirochaetia bacterium]